MVCVFFKQKFISMSRLDSFIRRLLAQKACIEKACDLINGQNGTIFELGLGNGRTYDHLVSLFGKERIFVFDRQIAAHPSCIPEQSNIILGNILETLPQTTLNSDMAPILIHSDIGTGDPEYNNQLTEKLKPALENALLPNGIIVSDQEFIGLELCQPIPLPENIAEKRYFMYQKISK